MAQLSVIDLLSMKAWFSYHWLKIVAVFILLGALTPKPLAYYQFMDWIVAGSALITMLQAHQHNKTITMWAFLFVSILYNPFAPFSLPLLAWQVIYALTAPLFFWPMVTLNPFRIYIKTT